MFFPASYRFVARSVHALALVLIVVGGCGDDGSSPNDGGGQPAVTVQANRTLGAWPHKFDVYSVEGATEALVFLHGGGGTKEYSAYQLGLKKTQDGANYAVADGQVLIDHKAIAVFPQGQTIDAAPNVPTWNNYAMDSGENDVQFLRELADHIKAQYKVSKVCIAGHSNGGMMVNRMWCEAPEVFDAYVAISGPPSEHFLSTPCNPSEIKPLLSIVGSADAVLQNTDWEAQTWTIDPLLTLTPAFVDPVLIGDRYFLPSRVTESCAETVGAGDADATTVGNLTTWSFCGGTVQLIRIEGANHPVESLEARSGRSLLDLALDFCDQ